MRSKEEPNENFRTKEIQKVKQKLNGWTCSRMERTEERTGELKIEITQSELQGENRKK